MSMQFPHLGVRPYICFGVGDILVVLGLADMLSGVVVVVVEGSKFLTTVIVITSYRVNLMDGTGPSVPQLLPT